MKKLLLIILLLLTIAVGLFLLVRSLMGWNGEMDNPRSEIHAAMLDGKIYVAGGIGLFRVLDSCEVYDTTVMKWSACAPLPRPLHHVAMAADEKRVFASGGYIKLPFEQDQDAALFVYDPKADKWTELAKLPHPIGQHVMVQRQGKLYMVGGQKGSAELATVWEYDLSSGDWTEKAPMPTARHSHASALAGDKLYITGGRSAALGSDIDIVAVYDFTKDSWETLPKMPVGRAGHGAFVRDQKLHVFGGESLSTGNLIPSHDILDFASGTWSKGTVLARPRHGFAIGDDGVSDEVHVIGGGAHAGLRTIYSVTGTTQKIGN